MGKNLARKALQDVNAYESPRGEGLWLNANEYPEGIPYTFREGVRFNYYPEMQPSRLRALYARYAGVNPNEVLITRGGDEAINTIVRTFCEAREDAYLYCPPTYVMYQAYGDIQGAIAKTVVTKESDNFAVNAKDIIAQLDGVKVVFICSPNNPTGQHVPPEVFREVLEAAKGKAIVVVDEAYVEFNPEKTLASWISEYPNLLIIRTLSKAFALAGLRCGFVLGAADLIEAMMTVIDPYAVSIAVADIAEQALSEEGIRAMRERVVTTKENRALLVEGLQKLPQVDKVFEASANFALVRFKDADKIMAGLARSDIYIRDQQHMPGLKNCLRISVGTKTEIEAVLKAIEGIN